MKKIIKILNFCTKENDWVMTLLLFISSFLLSSLYLYIVVNLSSSIRFVDAVIAVTAGTIYAIMTVFPLPLFLIAMFVLSKYSKVFIKKENFRIITILIISSVVYYSLIQVFI